MTLLDLRAGSRSANSLGVFGAALVMVIAALDSAQGRDRSLAERLREGPGLVNHPVGVIPSPDVRIPDHWPLTPEGTLGCLTCHTGLPNFQGRDPLLRGGHAPGRIFCAQCHDDGTSRGRAVGHWKALDQAHWGSSGQNAVLVGFGVDEASRKCLECHDGVNAPEAAYQTPWDRGEGVTGDRRRNHPIGVRYPRSGRMRAEVPLRPMTQLPPSVVLPNDTVSCLSCHNVFGRSENLLSVPIEGSKLCLTCHALD